MSMSNIKHLKSQCDIDNDDEVEEITAAITPMKKKKPVCVTYNQTFTTKKLLLQNFKIQKGSRQSYE